MEFPGSPVVRTWHFHCQGLGSIPNQGTKTLQAAQLGQKKKIFFFNLKKIKKEEKEREGKDRRGRKGKKERKEKKDQPSKYDKMMIT